MDGGPTRVRALVRGRVQGVGFRWWTRDQAEELGLTGWARNQPDGSVEVVAAGPRAVVEALLERLAGTTPGRPGRVEGVQAEWEPGSSGETGFRVG